VAKQTNCIRIAAFNLIKISFKNYRCDIRRDFISLSAFPNRLVLVDNSIPRFSNALIYLEFEWATPQHTGPGRGLAKRLPINGNLTLFTVLD
jgi:hypothetical protein